MSILVSLQRLVDNKGSMDTPQVNDCSAIWFSTYEYILMCSPLTVAYNSTAYQLRFLATCRGLIYLFIRLRPICFYWGHSPMLFFFYWNVFITWIYFSESETPRKLLNVLYCLDLLLHTFLENFLKSLRFFFLFFTE
jgi:hypothetical protein